MKHIKKFNEELKMAEGYEGAIEDISIGELIEMLQKYDPSGKMGFIYNGDDGQLALGRNGELLEKSGDYWFMHLVNY